MLKKVLTSSAVAAVLCFSVAPAMADGGPIRNQDGQNSAPLPIAALGLPLALGFAAFAMRRK